MDQDALKKQVAEAALRFVPEGEIIGVGTGSTANFFIDGLVTLKDRIKGRSQLRGYCRTPQATWH